MGMLAVLILLWKKWMMIIEKLWGLEGDDALVERNSSYLYAEFHGNTNHGA